MVAESDSISAGPARSAFEEAASFGRTSDLSVSLGMKAGAMTSDAGGHASFGPMGQTALTPQTHTVAFHVDGGGTAPLGISVFPGATAPHNATGNGTELGKYTGNEGLYQTLSFDPSTLTGTFHGSFVFVAANGDRFATNYGADPSNPGVFTVLPAGNGLVTVNFVATFTPDPAQSTGRFTKVVGGGWVMIANTAAFDPTPNAQGYTAPFAYTWSGEGSLVYRNG
jgi:hypothetical protein